ncbi:MAG: exo-alpha-sialidase [Kofleriaceae bacterium]|nr:MAG: exo-alpha-sialidase [Kofleriaceae bacterium]
MRTILFAAILVACGGPGDVPIDGANDGAPVVDAPQDAGSSDLAPGAAFLLSIGNATGQDEDPALAVDPRGRLWVAWYRDRGVLQPDGRADKEIVISSSTDAVTWSDPVPVSAGADWAFYPSIAVDAAGRVHAAWWQVHLLPDGCVPPACTGTANSIRYAVSADGAMWGPSMEVTAGPGDWLPALVLEPGTDVPRIYFAAVARRSDGTFDGSISRNGIFVTRRPGASWSMPVQLGGLDETAVHDSYPEVLVDGARYLLTWTRYAATSPADPVAVVSDTSTEVWSASSDAGEVFADLVLHSDGPGAQAVHVFPRVFADGAGRWLTWRTADGGPDRQVELPFDGTWSAAVARPEITGYTARVAETWTPGVLFAVWVEGSNPVQKIHARAFRRP